MADPVIFEAMTHKDLEACFAIRIDVFCGEQKVSREIEFDGLDDQCRHYLATWKNSGIGTARMRPLGNGEVKLERVAVRSEYRLLGIGRLLMARALADAKEEGYGTAVLNAQIQAGPFYEKLGFRAEGGEFLEADIPHHRMSKAL